MSRGVFLDSQTLDHHDIDFQPLIDTLPHWDLYSLTTPEQVIDRIKEATLVITNKVPLRLPEMQAAKKLAWIGVAATGYDQIDIQMAKARGIVVSNVCDYSSASVVQHTIGLIINAASHLADYGLAVRQGKWQQAPCFCLQDYSTSEVAGKTLGIIGYGIIGKNVGRVAAALGMTVQVCDSEYYREKGDDKAFAEWLGQCDYLTLHCRYTPETHHLMNAKTLAQLKKGAVLINTARGGLVDETALAAALRAGHLGGAATDVLAKEPPDENTPLLDQDLATFWVTPHVAWATKEARQRLLNGLVENVKAFLNGTPQNVVN